MEEYRNYLATTILSEDRIVTYRLLSRALKINVNTAKEMLYEFHRQQNAKKQGAIHAIYLVYGTKRIETPATNGEKKESEDEVMQSSPFDSGTVLEPMLEEYVTSVSLVREEDLDTMRSQYEHIRSIHVYSLGPATLKDLQVLSNVTRETKVLCEGEDPLEFNSKYGTILNKGVRRRTGHRPVIAVPPPVKPEPPKPKAAATPVPKPEPKITGQASSANAFFGKSKEKTKAAAPPNTSTSTPYSSDITSAQSSSKPAPLKRESSLMKSFANAKPKIKREDTDSSIQSGVENDAKKTSKPPVMFDDDDEDDGEEIFAPPTRATESAEDRKSRKDREAALRAMMEDEEDEEDAAMMEDEEDAAKMEEEAKRLEEAKKAKDDDDQEEEDKPDVQISDGRKRGRRRVMKKKTIKDEEGYLVTVQEAVWESFSEAEDEKPATTTPGHNKSKPAAKSTPSSENTKPKAKKPPAGGQGNIMSFFGKK